MFLSFQSPRKSRVRCRVRARTGFTNGQLGSTSCWASWEITSSMKSKRRFFILEYSDFTIRFYVNKQMTVSHQKRIFQHSKSNLPHPSLGYHNLWFISQMALSGLSWTKADDGQYLINSSPQRTKVNCVRGNLLVRIIS